MPLAALICFCVFFPTSRLPLRRNPSLRAEGLEESEEAEADGGVLPAGRLLLGNRAQPAEVPGVSGDPQQEGGGAGAFPGLLSLLLLQEVKTQACLGFF